MSTFRKIRQRQDLHKVTNFEREINDLAADDLYEQILFRYIRSGNDPNKEEAVEVFEGYVDPVSDPAREAKITALHKEFLHHIHHKREKIVRILHTCPEHQKRSRFDRILCETEYCTGMREWEEGDSRGASGQNRKSSYRTKEWDTNEDTMKFEVPRLTETPSYIRGTLRPYQIEGVNWLLGLFSRGVNGILADEMGLGKTFQTIAMLGYLKFTVGLPGPHVVVCPKSVMGNWYREFRHWCPALSVYKFHASSDLRPILIKSHFSPPEKLRYDVVVTTFEMVLEEIRTFKKIHWQYLIVDEAHKIKNEEGRAHALLNSLETSHRLIITGTPLQNNLKELWSLLHFLSPRLFEISDTLHEWFDSASGHQDKEVMSNMHKILAPLMIRRVKAEVNTGIPPKKEIYVSCKLTKKQREWYIHVLAKDSEALNRTSSNTTYLNSVLMSLRKVINHPYLMDGGEEGPPFITDEKLVKASGKMLILDKLLHRLKGDVEGKHKVLIFSQFTSMLNILEDYCNMRGFRYCRIDGNTSSYDRDSYMATFNSPNGESFIFLLSTRAGGLGINLQAANHVIIYDSDWNPQMDLQAQDRAHRIGQTRSVRVYRFVTDGTIEERIYRRALKKLYLNALVVQQGNLSSSISNTQNANPNGVSRNELLSMIRFGAEEIFRTRHVDITEADIDRLLDEGEAKSSNINNEAKQTVQMSLTSFKLGADEANIYDFEGISFRSGLESRILHLKLPDAIPQARLEAQCAAYGEVLRVVLHPNLKEALVQYRTLNGAIDAKSGLPYEAAFVSKEAQTIVPSEMISEGLGAGEKLGRGHRARVAMTPYTEADVEQIQTKASKAPPLKLPKAPKFHHFHLFNAKRLLELHNTEVGLMVQNWKRKYSENNTGEEPDAEAPNKEGGDNADETLTATELEERERLLSEGFPTWTFHEYRQLIKVLISGKVDIHDYDAITAELNTPEKTVAEVRDYVNALLERGEQCVHMFDKLEKRIQKAQGKFQEKKDSLRAAKWKIEQYNCPEQQLTFKGKISFPELQRQIFLLGYDTGFKEENIGENIRKLPQNAFNVWYMSTQNYFYSSALHRLMHSVKREWATAMGEESGEGGNRRRFRTEQVQL
ncbi:unnamed protein product [Phytomonas sp. Hart1]|nr:unnamed protein product [Phytomonas sp. Hart1]|eukprot:CCW66257.1 unnamed protein product [Phytomonas sp. isolate Hart1]